MEQAPIKAGMIASLAAFFEEAARPVFSRRMIAPALFLAVLLTASNIVILLNVPEKGAGLPMVFVAAAMVRIVGLLVGCVAVLRVLADSDRPAWKPDGAFWLYGVTMVAGIALAAGSRILFGARMDFAAELASGLLLTLISAPLAVWFTAIAVERPLAWRPGPFFAHFGNWLPHLVFWAVLLETPLGALHGHLDKWLVAGAGDWFWPIALIDGPMSAVMAIAGLAFAAAAYRRVARS
jgi:hypothetical protein